MLLLAAALSSCAGGGREAEEVLFTKIGQHVLPKSRMVELNCVVSVVDVPRDAKELRLWVPYPSGDIVQHASERTVDYPSDYRPLVRYDEYGTPYVFMSGERPLPSEFKVEYVLKVRRDELGRDASAAAATGAVTEEDLAPIGDVDAAQLKQIVDGLEPVDNSTTGKARAIVDYVVKTLEYDVSAEGAGTGSVKHALESGRGTYLDYAMTTAALMRAGGIASRVESGYLLPEHRRPERSPLTERAAWVRFRASGVWSCADPCLADRFPELADYMFGGLCANRIHLSTGPGRRLDPEPKTPVPVPFIRAFGEAEEKPLTVETRFFFRDAVGDEDLEIEP
jgi:hypothetical protein